MLHHPLRRSWRTLLEFAQENSIYKSTFFKASIKFLFSNTELYGMHHAIFTDLGVAVCDSTDLKNKFMYPKGSL
jgi:hypothetical protein